MTKKKRTVTKIQRRSGEKRPEPRSFHDEPFVIDNYPFGIDVGEKHVRKIKAPGIGKVNWTRDESHLDSLLLATKAEGDSQYDVRQIKLDTAKEVRIQLAGGAFLNVSLALNPANPHESVLTIKPDKVKLKKDGKRRLKNNQDAELRIESVELYEHGKSTSEKIPMPEGSVHLIFYLGA
jgi:hypothetical protein